MAGLYPYNYECPECCSRWGDGAVALETQSVEFGGVGITDLYPFRNNESCGGCTTPKAIGCEANYIYFASMTTNCESFTVDPDYCCDAAGCNKTDTVEMATEEELETPPIYYSCSCNGDQLNCSKNCGDGDRDSSDKLIYEEVKINTSGGDPCECGGLGEDACSGCIGDLDPRIVETRSVNSCSFQFPYFSGNCEDPEPSDPNCYSWATNTTTYSDSIDIREFDGTEIADRLSAEPYPNQWNEFCGQWGYPSSFPQLLVSATGTKNWQEPFELSGGCDESSTMCPEQIISSVELTKKYKLRWKVQTPMSCYVKLWICRWKYTEEDTLNAGKIYTLENSSIEQEIINISEVGGNGECFDPTNLSCSDNALWRFKSNEYELDSSKLVQFPSDDPNVTQTILSKTTHEGMAIIGVSHVDGWNPPLYQFGSDVWECRVSIDKIYSCPYAVLNSSDYPTSDENSNTCWPMTPVELQALQDNFDTVKNISTCDAP